MNIFIKILKRLVLVIISFVVLSAILAALITFTPFRENWAGTGMLTIVTFVCMVAGYLMGTLFDSKGIVVGFISSVTTVEILFLCVQLVFLGEVINVLPDVFYLISVLLGTVGGIVGVNSNK